jgi:hypothetical protein
MNTDMYVKKLLQSDYKIGTKQNEMPEFTVHSSFVTSSALFYKYPVS